MGDSCIIYPIVYYTVPNNSYVCMYTYLQFSEMEAVYEKACREIDEMAEAYFTAVSISNYQHHFIICML